MSKRKVQSEVSIFIGSITVNGEKLADIDYSRVIYDDGSVEERGTPPRDGFAAALVKIQQKQAPTRKGKR